METIEQILYSKLTASDFQKMYNLNRPNSGGGQTYIELAGISVGDLVSFFEYALKNESSNPDDMRYEYLLPLYTLGKATDSLQAEDWITVSPRFNRSNYRIKNQTIEHKHPAWKPTNGFPEPNRLPDGSYDTNCTNIISNLTILILRTSHRKYYAAFINQQAIPQNWPTGIGLERIFQSTKRDHRGTIDISDCDIAFKNDQASPFDLSNWSANQPEHLRQGENVLVYGIPGSGKSFKVNQVCEDSKYVERVVFHPDYSYSDFVGQIMPESQDGNISYPFVPGPFTRILKKAKDRRHNYYLIIEELNRGNAPAIFGDIFQLLDRVKTETGDKEIGESYYSINNKQIAEEVDGPGATCVKIPHNLIIIATMNTADQNVFTLDTAFKRRWRMYNVMGSMNKCEYRDDIIANSDIKWADFVRTINKLIIDNGEAGIGAEDKRLGPYFASKEELSDTNKFAQKVLMYLWTDVFKQNHDKLFSKECGSLDDVLRTANADIKAVFSPDIVFSPAQTDGADEDSSEIDAPIFDDLST